jgi:hypothetical protein
VTGRSLSDQFPFVLSVAKHKYDSFSNLLEKACLDKKKISHERQDLNRGR